MRFPVDPPPPIGVAEDPYDIQETTGIRPVRPVGAPLSQQRLVGRRPRPVASPPAPVQPAPPPVERRSGEDRRKGDRRVANLPVLVDTRSGIDRRRAKRRNDDPTTRVDEKA
ncbi:hypothetical protein [Thiobacter aerophilum]|uniref:Uncharacterized protein n=1 Tax=Thiobacter aerophilum TaxID=3121275 RepID=A0ABV0EHX3_9BURK